MVEVVVEDAPEPARESSKFDFGVTSSGFGIDSWWEFGSTGEGFVEGGGDGEQEVEDRSF